MKKIVLVIVMIIRNESNSCARTNENSNLNNLTCNVTMMEGKENKETFRDENVIELIVFMRTLIFFRSL
jgi:hypothetical protein